MFKLAIFYFEAEVNFLTTAQKRDFLIEAHTVSVWPTWDYTRAVRSYYFLVMRCLFYVALVTLRFCSDLLPTRFSEGATEINVRKISVSVFVL